MDPTPPEPPMLILAQYVKYFSFENPNAERSCGCGTSFTPKAPS